MIGILLAGGFGTRMYPTTLAINKHLIPIFDKPMIYYPLSILIMLKIKKIVFISTSRDQESYKRLFKNFNHLGLDIKYLIQDKPNGIAESINISKKFIKGKRICLILGDNIFYGSNLKKILQEEKKKLSGATIFSHHVNNPNEFAVISYDKKNNIKSIVEKPKKKISNQIITGIYFFDDKVLNFFNKIKPSARGELEITDLLNEYIKIDKINVRNMGRGIVWFDAGNEERLLEISSIIGATQARSGFKIACIEEMALNNKWITKKKLSKIIRDYPNHSYKKYIKKIINY